MPFGNAVGQGFTRQQIHLIILSSVSGFSGFFFYNGLPAAGNLVMSITNAVGNDPQGNAYLKGVTSYLAGATYSAVNLNGGEINYYTAPSGSGPWTLAGNLLITLSGSTLVVNFSNLSGAINVPQPPVAGLPLSLPPPPTYSQVGIAPLYNAVNNIYAMLGTANVHN